MSPFTSWALLPYSFAPVASEGVLPLGQQAFHACVYTSHNSLLGHQGNAPTLSLLIFLTLSSQWVVVLLWSKMRCMNWKSRGW